MQQNAGKLSMLILGTGVLLLTSCWFWEKRAPQRSFSIADLLLDQDTVPKPWEVGDSYFPAGDELCTTECAGVPLVRMSKGDQSIVSGQQVYRYLGAGIAEREFRVVYLKMRAHLDPVDGWSFQNPLAEQWHVGCGPTARNLEVWCQWGGVYEEYIVTFSSPMVPGEVSLADIEDIVRAMDTRIGEYLGKSL